MSAITQAACLTPAGTGAIAVLAARGPRALEIAEALFRPRNVAVSAEPGRFFLGQFGDEASDEVVLSVKQIVPVPCVEIHCHGGVEVVRVLLESLRRRGVEILSWQEWQRHESDEPFQAIAAALAEARTARTAAILLDQYHGAFGRAMREIHAALERGDNDVAGRKLEELAEFAELGRHLAQPWRVVVAGPPNVGKSSLVNAVAGYRRSVVSAIPGTTRDAVTTQIAVDGWPVELTDTAGLRDPAEDLEAQGIDLARAAMNGADLCLWVMDGSTAPVPPAISTKNPRLVVNKIDLPAAWDYRGRMDVLPVSAATGQGVAELCSALAGWLVPRPPAPGSAVPFTPEQRAEIEETRHRLRFRFREEA